MAMQQGGKTLPDGGTSPASGPVSGGGSPLSEAQAESYAASYRPAWDIEYEPTSLDPSQASSPAAPVRVELNPKTGKTLILGSGAVVPPAPDSIDDAAKTLELPADRSASKKPAVPSRATSEIVRERTASAASTEELNAFVASRTPKRAPLFIALGLGVVIGAVILTKVLPQSEAPAPNTTSETAATTKATEPTAKAEREEVPPPPAPPEPAPEKVVAPAAPPPEPAPAASPEPAAKPTVAPPTTATAAAAPPKSDPKPVAATPASKPKAAPPPLPPPSKPAAPAATHTAAPKSTGAGIVRDSPF